MATARASPIVRLLPARDALKQNVFRMRARAPRSPRPTWRLWPLLAAWLCASLPQTALFTALTWLAEARTFSHQQRLSRDVAHLLGGAQPERPIAESVARAQEQVPPAPLPPIASEPAGTKIDLSLERTTEPLPPPSLAADYPPDDPPSARSWHAQPPHRPPRAAAA